MKTRTGQEMSSKRLVKESFKMRRRQYKNQKENNNLARKMAKTWFWKKQEETAQNGSISKSSKRSC